MYKSTRADGFAIQISKINHSDIFGISLSPARISVHHHLQELKISCWNPEEENLSAETNNCIHAILFS